MKRTVVTGLVLVGLAGCTAMRPGQDPYAADTDTAYVATVERAARQAGVEVHWFNPPRKRAGTK
jgi:hypothetical protein